MESLDVLKRIPQEHYTQYKGKCIMVKDLVKIVEEEIDRKKEKKRRKKRNGSRKKK